MIYTKMTQRAMKLCFEAHKGQLDKGGMPYVFHLFHIAEQMEIEETITVALLHDVIEDTEYALQNLTDMGFSEQVTTAMSLLMHDKSELCMDYIAKIKENSIARIVKLADLRHNSDLSRLSVVDENAIQRVQKYKEAIEYLQK